MLTLLILVATYGLIFPPLFIRKRKYFALSILAFSLLQVATILSFYYELNDPNLDDGASIIIAGGLVVLPMFLLVILLMVRALSILFMYLYRKWRYDSRRVALFSVVIIMIAIGFLLFRANHTLPTDCEMARYAYATGEEESFESFLTERFRTIGIIETGGLFSNPRYSYSIYHPKRETVKYKNYDHLLSRSGNPYSQRSISISQKEWQMGRTIECANNEQN